MSNSLRHRLHLLGKPSGADQVSKVLEAINREQRSTADVATKHRGNGEAAIYLAGQSVLPQGPRHRRRFLIQVDGRELNAELLDLLDEPEQVRLIGPSTVVPARRCSSMPSNRNPNEPPSSPRKTSRYLRACAQLLSTTTQPHT